MIVCCCSGISSKYIKLLYQNNLVQSVKDVYNHYNKDKKGICSCCPKQIEKALYEIRYDVNFRSGDKTYPI